mmetsp:Transcript_33856/g.95858  ORF Transcript_33856/g.95858 Transcript_33856/m.95858 type:complete len:117 (-) Transcript_33856:312-662(-)
MPRSCSLIKHAANEDCNVQQFSSTHGWEIRPQCHSWANISPPLAWTASVTAFQPATCSSEYMPGVKGYLNEHTQASGRLGNVGSGGSAAESQPAARRKIPISALTLSPASKSGRPR